MKATKSPSGLIGTSTASGGFQLNANGSVIQIGGVATVGNPGVPAVVVHYKSGSTHGAITNGVDYTPAAAIGAYRLNIVVDCTVGTTSSFAVVVGYTDFEGTAHTDTVTLFPSTTPGAFLLNGLVVAAGWYYAFPLYFEIDNSATPITLSTTGTFTTVTYFLRAVLEKIS